MLKQQLRERILSLGWNVKTTAERTGLHRDMISRLLRGASDDPRLSTMQKLCRGLGITLEELVGKQDGRG